MLDDGLLPDTLVLVDIATGWTECVALLRRSEADVIGALNSLRGRLPVPLLGLDTDNASEFINYEMLRYCQREQITFTRSRVNRKNDQAFVEEKNGSIVRRLIGYDQYEGLGAWRALIQLYEILRLYVNFFQPSMNLIEKQRDGARVKKRYDRAQTPYQRVIASAYLTKRKRERIESLYRKLGPVTLLKELEQRQDHFGTFANGQRELDERRVTPASTAQNGNSYGTFKKTQAFHYNHRAKASQITPIACRNTRTIPIGTTNFSSNSQVL